MIITPKVGMVFGKTDEPNYTFTITVVDPISRKFEGTSLTKGKPAYDAVFGWTRIDGTYDLPDPFMLLADPEPVKTTHKRIQPVIGLVLRKVSDPSYTFTITKITSTDAHGTAQSSTRNDPSAYYPKDKDGLLDLVGDFFTLPNEDQTNKTMTTTKHQCYNCGKECFDKASRTPDTTSTAWCGECAQDCADRSKWILAKEVPQLLKQNGVCLVSINDAEKASPTLKTTPKIKVEVGQVWRREPNTQTITITAIKDNRAQSEGWHAGASLTPEGYPKDWDKEWRLVKHAPQGNPIAEAGQTYRRDDGWTVKITSIRNGFVEALQIGDHSSYNDGDHHTNMFGLDNGRVRERWKLIEEKPVDTSKIKMRVGQIWKSDNGISCLITEVRKDRSISVIRTWGDKTDAFARYGSVNPDGTASFGYGWHLAQDVDYSKTKVEVGQTWANAGSGAEVKVSGIEGRYALNQSKLRWGILTSEGYPDGWAPGWTITKIEKIELSTPQMKIGQVWKNGKTGEDHRIVGIKNGRLNVLQGKSLKVLDGFGTIKSDGTPGADWGTIEESGWHIEREEPLKIKVGQRWRWIGYDTSIKDKVFTIKSINSANEAFMDGTTYVVHGDSNGVVKNVAFTNWELVEDVSEMQDNSAKPDIGSVWKDRLGVSFRIKDFHADTINATTGKIRYHVKLEKKHHSDGTWDTGYSWDWVDGKFDMDGGKDWTPDLPEVGSIWKRESDGKHFRVRSVKQPVGGTYHVSLERELVSGEWSPGYAWDWKDGAFVQDGRQNWTLKTAATVAVPVPGQIWNAGGNRYRIVSFNPLTNFVQLDLQKSDGSWEQNRHSWNWTDGKFQKLAGNEWTLEETKDAGGSDEPKVGSIWKNGSYRYRVVKFLGGIGRNVSLESYVNGVWITGSSWEWRDGKFLPLYGDEWILEKETYSEPKVGQIWDVSGSKYRIKEIKPSSLPVWDKEVFVERLDGTFENSWPWKDGKFDSCYDWKLETDVPMEPIKEVIEPKVGQLWKGYGDKTYRITKIVDASSLMKKLQRVYFESKKGDVWENPNQYWDWIGGNRFDSGYAWTLLSDAPTTEATMKEMPDVKVGQIWNSGTSEYRISKVENGLGYLESKNSHNGTYSYAGGWYLTNGKWDRPITSQKEWTLISDVPPMEAPVKELPDVKVGQIWSFGDGSNYRISKIEKDLAYFEPEENKKDVYGKAWYLSGGKWKSPVNDKDWVLISDVKDKVEETKQEETMEKELQALKVGQIWTLGSTKYRVRALEGSPRNVARLDRLKPDGTWVSGSDFDYVRDGKFQSVSAGWVLEQDVAPEKPEKLSFRQMMGADMVNASYRVAATQLTKASKQALLSLLEKQGHNSSNIKALSELLDTEIGSSLVGMALGMGLTYIPQVSNSGRAQRLATEFRTGSMAVAGNVIADAMTEHFIPVITNAFSGLPKEQIRVASLPVHAGEEADTHEENEKTAQA